MHEKITAIAFFLTSCLLTNAQTFDHNDFEKSVKVFDAEGKPFVNPAVDVEGSQFFFSDWKAGSIKLNSNYVYNNIVVRLNLQSQEVHYLNPNKMEMSVLPELVKELFIYDTANGDIVTYDFQCGFPAVDKQTEKDFYLVLSTGKIKLLKSIKKEINERKDDVFGAPKKEFVTDESYFLYNKKSSELIKVSKTSLLAAMKDHEDKINEYVKTNRFSYKKGDDLKKIVDFYNAL